MIPLNRNIFLQSLASAGLFAATTSADKQEGHIRLAENILLYQRNNGGWPKNYDREHLITDEERRKLQRDKDRTDTTFDNGATYTEVRYLAQAYTLSGDNRFRDACRKGISFMLEAQYSNGGWPQFHPSPRGYAKHITFNDNAMIGVMRTLREIAKDRKMYPFVNAHTRKRCTRAVENGIQCIIACQIEVSGTKTAWCAQHDEQTLEPRKARSYELASLSGSESVGIVRFLMSIDEPSPDVIEAVQHAVGWFKQAALPGIRVEKVNAPGTPKGTDLVVIQDSKAPPMWARFYDIETNQPIFCSRDGIPKESLAEISYERRNGYSWLGYYPAKLLSNEYPEWQRRWINSR